MKNIVVAHDRNMVIGSNGAMPWHGELPADMTHFKELTEGHTVIMGRKTYESIGKALPNRRNLVLSRRTKLELPGCEVIGSLNQAYELAESEDEVFVIGGESVYRLAMPLTDHLYVTYIDHSFIGDTFFVAISNAEWQEVCREDHQSDDRNLYNYSFITYERIR